MTVKNESFDLIRAKQELDIVLSTITGIVLSDDVVRETSAAMNKVQKISRGGESYEHFDLIREKKEIDAFLSGITIRRSADEIAGKTGDGESEEVLKEQQPAAMQNAVVSSISDADVSARREPESKDFVDEEKGVADNIQEGEQAETARAQKKHTMLREETPVEKETGAARIKVEAPRKEDQHVKEKTTVVKEREKSLWGARIRIIGLFAVFIVITQAYLWLHPDVGYHTIEWTRTHIPLIDQLLGEEQGNKNFIIDKIELTNVSQRLVQNASLGTLMIIEGTAVNQADFAVAKVKVMGELSDSRGKLLAARTSYCGNILSSEGLERLQEEDILTRSSIPREDTIAPKGQMPFMIVFKWKQAAGAKASVMAVSAEKVSP
jgi:hypothetical protein